MKKLKLISLSVVFVCTTTFLNAQTKQISDEKKIEHRKTFKANMEKLNLSEDQKTSFKAIQKKYGEKLRLVRQSEGDKSAKMSEIKAIMEQQNGEIKMILSESQYNDFIKMQEERKNKFK